MVRLDSHSTILHLLLIGSTVVNTFPHWIVEETQGPHFRQDMLSRAGAVQADNPRVPTVASKTQRPQDLDQGMDLIDTHHRRGKKLLDLLQRDDPPGDEPTNFNNFRNIESNGWRTENFEVERASDAFHHAKSAMAALNLPDLHDSSWEGIELQQPRLNEGGSGHHHGDTDGSRIVLLNPKHGMILVVKSDPFQDTKVNPLVEESMLYTRWAGLNFTTWQHFAKSESESGAIKHIMHVNITNEDTKAVMQAFAPHSDLSNLPSWPGMNIDPESLQGEVMLGSSEGQGADSILAQRKRNFGSRTRITKVTVWDAREGEWERRYLSALPCLLFTIDDPTQE